VSKHLESQSSSRDADICLLSCPIVVPLEPPERVKLDSHAEYFNVFNHPMFGASGNTEPNSELGLPVFGTVFNTTNNDLGGGGSDGGQSMLYALCGPRSAQLTLKVIF
jgi:hypothetical protein